MELAIYNKAGQDTGRKVTLSDDIFSIEPNDHAIYLDVKQHMANKRQGTHKSKERSEVSGSTRKLKRQKGTGGARSGDINSPLFVGGGRVFGPRPRDYSFKLNKKVKILARKSALAYKVQENNLIVIEDFQLDQPKTKEMVAIMKNLNISDKKSLFLVSESNKSIYLSSRNLQRTLVVNASDVNTYSILNAAKLVISESSVQVIESILGRNN